MSNEVASNEIRVESNGSGGASSKSGGTSNRGAERKEESLELGWLWWH